MYDKPIRMFEQTGVIHDEKALGRIRLEIEKIIEDDMRSKGYVPVLDLGSGYFTFYNDEKDTFNFRITVYGIYIGKRKAYEWRGYNMGKLIHPMTSGELLSH
jgi:hypothetical protein